MHHVAAALRSKHQGATDPKARSRSKKGTPLGMSLSFSSFAAEVTGSAMAVTDASCSSPSDEVQIDGYQAVEYGSVDTT